MRGLTRRVGDLGLAIGDSVTRGTEELTVFVDRTYNPEWVDQGSDLYQDLTNTSDGGQNGEEPQQIQTYETNDREEIGRPEPVEDDPYEAPSRQGAWNGQSNGSENHHEHQSTPRGSHNTGTLIGRPSSS